MDILSEVWHRALTTQPAPSGRVVALTAILAVALVWVPAAWGVTRHVVTIAHEAAHGFAALLSGRKLHGIRLHSDTSGLTVSAGRTKGAGMILTAASGYVGPGLLGLGAASRIGIYDYLGYYDVCYIGDEVKDPGRVIPRSILLSIVGVAFIYLGVNLSIIGVVSWRDFVPAAEHPESNFVVSTFMERIYGHHVAAFFTGMVLWTAFASVFALLLGYSRIPYAAAQDGYFFKVFGRLHPSKGFPHISLLAIGILSILCSFFSLGLVIDALITTRILVQFMGQIGAVTLLRKRKPEMNRPYLMWLYPLPSLLALAGWIFLFATSEPLVIYFGLGTLVLGVLGFVLWSWRVRQWPFSGAAA